jgi:2,4-diketo-3-deoxy-L-fuconate hydrolase
MPGIGNPYFRPPDPRLNVQCMTSAPAGYALGVFRRPAAQTPEDVFTGLVRGDRVRDVSALGTVNDLLADWEGSQRKLDELAHDDHADAWTDLAALDVRCPVAPAQILQCGANYRSHVVDIVMAERRADESTTGHNSDTPASEVRAWAERMMDERAATGSPYVFAGLPSALTGPYDEIVLP